MGDINLLPEEVILKIAAGEVIDRPASVIKELIENSLDAKANTIIVETGKDYMSVKDNGKGMSYDDIKVCFYPHSTSKLENSESLFNINTLGFRGEALSSIATVSLLEVTSKRDPTAYKIIVQDDNIHGISPSAYEFETGTEVVVKKLFYNTPARKKYLKTDSTENRKIKEILEKYLLAYKKVSFKFIIDGKVTLNAPAEGDPKKRFYQVYRNEAKQMIDLEKVSTEDSLQTKTFLLEKGIRVRGLISKPSLSKKSRSDQIIFVNNRLIRNKTIYSAISQAYKGYLHSKENPVLILKIKVDPKKIDVNIHPQKQEIKFIDESMIFKAVYSTIKNALQSEDLSFNHSFNEKQEKIINKEDIKETTNFFSPSKPTVSQTFLKDENPVKQEREKIYSENKEKAPLRIIGFFNKEFIIAENEKKDNLALIDFHAAAEIVNYEKMKKQFEDSSIKYQSLIEPKIIEFSNPDIEILRMNLDFIKRLGFFAEEFGSDSLIIRSLPVVMGKTLSEEKLKDIASALKDGIKANYEDLKENIIKVMSCRASEKAGDELTIIQAKKIIDDLFQLKGNSYNCPHGRPTIVEITLDEIEKMFKRKI